MRCAGRSRSGPGRSPARCRCLLVGGDLLTPLDRDLRTTNRDGIGQSLESASSTRPDTPLGRARLDIDDGLLIVELKDDDVFVVVRLAPAHEAVRARSEQALEKIACGNIKS